MNTTSPLNTAVEAADRWAERTAARADEALQTTREGADHAIDSIKNNVDDLLRDSGPAALTRAAAKADELAHRSLERAREASAKLQAQVERAGTASTNYIRDEPLKAVLIAAATGAVVAGLIGWWTRAHTAPRG